MRYEQEFEEIGNYDSNRKDPITGRDNNELHCTMTDDMLEEE